MSTNFRVAIPDLLPPYMQGPNLRTLWGSFGAQMDANAATVMFSRLQAIPFAGGANATREGAARLRDGRLIECEPFVLPIHADQRGIRLYDTEVTLSRRIRLASYLLLHAQRGTHRGEMNHVRPYFSFAAAYPGIDIVHQTGSGIAVWHRMSAAGVYSLYRPATPNFNYDDRPTKRSRFWAFLRMYGTGIAPPNVYGDGHTYGDGEIYGTAGLNISQHADIVAMIRDWKGAHSWLAGVALVWDNTSVDPAGTPTQDPTGWWSLPSGAGTWAAAYSPTTHLATRPPTVQWIYDNPAP